MILCIYLGLVNWRCGGQFLALIQYPSIILKCQGRMEQLDTRPRIFRMECSRISRHQFLWQLFRFLIFNYYLIEAVLASSFYSMYLFTQTTLMPMNIVFFVYLGFDFVFKVASTPKPEFAKRQDYRKPKKVLKYYLLKKLLIFDILFLILFIGSYVAPFPVAKYLRMVILIKLLDVADFNNKIYEKIHIYPKIRKIYTIIKIFYVILLFSHYFGTWFYLMDQVLLDEQFYGTPAQANQLYYQMNLLAFTPIEMLDDAGRYLYGLYFMVSLITTIAYGDIIGKNAYEQVYVSVLMVLSTISLALILQQFMDLVRYDSLGLYDFIKNYNSLKTCMDDSQVPYAIQNKVRSYLVYTEYEKKYHAHEEVAQKLTQKLQLDLKTESYSQCIGQWLVPCLPELRDNVKQICNLCRLVSFQAQTNIYEQLETVETATQCCFLYKIGGLVEEFIQLSHSKIRIPTNGRKHFNLSTLLLNFNMDVAYDSDEEDEEDFEREIEPEDIAPKKYVLTKVNNRKLKSIKISQFIVLDAQQFYEFINTKKLWFKRIKQAKQQILSGDFSSSLTGQYCTVCPTPKAYDHSIEDCPSMHLTYKQKITNSQRLDTLVNRNVARAKKERARIVSKKFKNLSLFQKSIFSFLIEKQQQEEKPIENYLMVNIFKNILGSITQKSKREEIASDSLYDPNGLVPNFFLETD